MPEEGTFAVLVKLMQDYCLRELFKPSMAELGLCMYKLECLIQVSVGSQVYRTCLLVLNCRRTLRKTYYGSILTVFLLIRLPSLIVTCACINLNVLYNSPFPTEFSKDLYCRHVKPGLVWERVKLQNSFYGESRKHYGKR